MSVFVFRHRSLSPGYPMFDRSRTLDHADPDVWAAVQKENVRQEQHIELIASENYTSPAVMQAQGTQLTNKYAEGYPGKRYYGGCEFVDIVEQLAIDQIGRAHVWTPVTSASRMPPSALKKKKKTNTEV